MVVKIVFLLAALGLTILVFFVSWFWRLLLIPMIVVLLLDGVRGLVRKEK